MRKIRMAWAALALAAAHHMAGAAPTASVALVASQLQLQTTALTDGSTPFVTFAPAFATSGSDPTPTILPTGSNLAAALVSVNTEVQSSEQWAVPGAPFPTETASYTSADGIARISVAPATVSTQLVIDAPQLSSLWADHKELSSGVIMWPDIALNGEGVANTWVLTVSPHTRVDLSGNLQMSVRFDAEEMNMGFARLGLPSQVLPSVQAYGTTSVSYWLLGDGAGDSASSDFNDGLEYSLGQDPGSPTSLDVDRLMDPLAIVNDSDVARQYGVYTVFGVGLVFGQNVIQQPEVGVVPEPGSWALMGLGLLAIGGLGTAQLRRRHPLP